MEQISNPRALVQSAIEGHLNGPIQRAPLDQPVIIDPTGAWHRLHQVQLDPVLLKKNRIVTATPNDDAATFDMLRTQTLAHMRKNSWRRLAITAPKAGYGTSTVVANLALSLARKGDLRTLVFDFNLRRPGLINLFGLAERGPRFSALQDTHQAFDTSCLRIGEGLGLSLNATPSDTSAELIGSRETRTLLTQIEESYAPDLIIFDLPPLLECDDAVAALDMVDCALLVAEADRSSLDQIDKSERLLTDQTNCLGTVLNRCRFPEQSV